MIQRFQFFRRTEIPPAFALAYGAKGHGKMSALLFVGLSVLTVAIIGCVLFARQLRPGTTIRDCDECPLMVVIPAGNFVMGDSLYGHPPHRVKIRRPFAVARDMITRDEYAEFVAESRYSAGNTWEDPALRQTGGNPVVNVNWDDARAYVRWLSGKTFRPYRLLSESEYEYAERAGSTTAFWWGDEAAPVCLYANFHDCSSGPVAAMRTNGAPTVTTSAANSQRTGLASGAEAAPRKTGGKAATASTSSPRWTATWRAPSRGSRWA